MPDSPSCIPFSESINLFRSRPSKLHPTTLRTFSVTSQLYKMSLKRHTNEVPASQASKIGFESYVDIAMNMVMHDTDLERLKTLGINDWTMPERANKNIDAQCPDQLKLEWRTRIRHWQEKFPDGGPRIENLTALSEFEFGALFLHHPLSAMSLWNVMQAFYALDRLVCCKSAADLERVAKWETMPVISYLDANNVEKTWRASLSLLAKELQEDTKVKVDVFMPAGLRSSPVEALKTKIKEDALRRIDGISFGTTKLEEAQMGLRETWGTNLRGPAVVDSMLEKIRRAAEIRFSMINNSLKPKERGQKDGEGQTIEDPVKPEEEEEIIKPLKRKDSFVKRELTIAWISTGRGDASPLAIVLLLILLSCLHKLRRHIVAESQLDYGIYS
ncbi:hypothetical protein DL98DRAFT_171559 [Cadophora sp. DSE1049]|nr:hypothetical protein DL98DRAFT_171559 [Cadophora sp. DSE1049]